MPQVRLNAKGDGCARDVIVAPACSEASSALEQRKQTSGAMGQCRLLLDVHGISFLLVKTFGQPEPVLWSPDRDASRCAIRLRRLAKIAPAGRRPGQSASQLYGASLLHAPKQSTDARQKSAPACARTFSARFCSSEPVIDPELIRRKRGAKRSFLVQLCALAAALVRQDRGVRTAVLLSPNSRTSGDDSAPGMAGDRDQDLADHSWACVPCEAVEHLQLFSVSEVSS
jgi:hypothetical protein